MFVQHCSSCQVSLLIMCANKITILYVCAGFNTIPVEHHVPMNHDKRSHLAFSMAGVLGL